MTQPEALRLADALWQELKETDSDDNVICVARWFVEDADKELRRLHEVNQELLEALNTFANADLNESNCASLDVATRRIRSVARAAIAKARGESK